MLTIASENSIKTHSKSDLYNHVSFNFTSVKTIENKIFNILENDKKLVNPVFLFIKDDVIQKFINFVTGNIRRPVAIGIAGETASGKSTFTLDTLFAIDAFQERLRLKSLVTRVNTDDYYYDRSEMVKAAGGFANFAKKYDLDVPEAIELDLLKNHIEQLVLGNDVWLPKYHMDGSAIRTDKHKLASPNPIIVSEGMFNLNNKVKDVFDFCIYVEVSPEQQKERFFRRAEERGLGDAAQNIYENAVSKAQIHVRPTKQNADIIINGEAERHHYENAVSQILDIIQDEIFAVR